MNSKLLTAARVQRPRHSTNRELLTAPREQRAEACTNRHLLSAEQAAELLGLQTKTIRNWIAARRIGVYRIGRAVRIPESEIERILDESHVPAVEGGAR
jgi:excisionase family DNA binding protein